MESIAAGGRKRRRQRARGGRIVPAATDLVHNSIPPLDIGKLRPLPAHLHAHLFPSLAPADVRRFGVHGDGTCFFHSLAAAINFNDYVSLTQAERQELGQSFRCSFKDTMDTALWDKLMGKTPHNMKKSFREVKASFCRSKEWAEETMIKYTSEHLHLNIVFIDGTSGMFYCQVAGDPRKQDTVVMMWVQHSHFEPVLFVRETCDNHVHVFGRLRHNDAQDAAIITHIMTQFDTMCASGKPPWAV